MRIAIDVKTNKKAIRPSTDNIIMYDGKDWYVTTKQDLFKEYDTRFDKKLQQCDEKIQEVDRYMVQLAEQMLELNELVKIVMVKEKEIR